MKEKTKLQKRLIFSLVAISFISVFLTFVTLAIFTILAFEFGDWEILFPPDLRPRAPIMTMIFVTIGSLFIGLIVSAIISNRFLEPVNELKKMTSKVAKGDFTVQMENIPDNELGEFIQDFNTMIKELKKNELLKNDFVSNVSHEFKTPLSIIEGYVTLLQDPSLDEESKQKYTQIVIDATKKLNTLINNILKISKLDNRKISVVNDEFYLDEQIRESVLFFEVEWSNKNIEFDIDLEIVNIKSDKNLLVNVWQNLIGNAIKFSPKNSTIFISLIKENNSAKIIIKDCGSGINEEDIPYIFDKFFQSDKSHKSEGNGLGLTLVKDIIDLLNGRIEVESEIGKGTSFVVYLPLKKN